MVWPKRSVPVTRMLIDAAFFEFEGHGGLAGGGIGLGVEFGFLDLGGRRDFGLRPWQQREDPAGLGFFHPQHG